MFTDFRNDDTQNLFTEAVKSFKGRCYGFENGSIIVLTTDSALLKTLAKIQQEDNLVKTQSGEKFGKINKLNFGGFGIDPNQKLSTVFSNALYFKQGEYANLCDAYSPEMIGGEKTLVLSSSAEEFKKFIIPIFEKHYSDFNIDLYNQSWFVDPTEPRIRVNLVVNNKAVELQNDGVYCSRLLFREAPEEISKSIDHSLFGSNEKERN